MYEFKLPDLGEGIHEAEILKWHLAQGEPIAEDAPLVDLETDKAAVTIPSPVGGTVVRLAGEVGETLVVGQVVAVIDDGAGTQSQSATPSRTTSAQRPAGAAAAEEEGAANVSAAAQRPVGAAAAGEVSAVAASATAQRAAGAAAAEEEGLGDSALPGDESIQERRRGPVPAAPATRRLARELGVTLGSIRGSGPGGRVTKGDVESAAAGQAVQANEEASEGPASRGEPRDLEPDAASTESQVRSGIPFLVVEPLPDFSALGPVEKEPLRSIRRKVARKMTQANLLVAQVSHTDEADITELDALRRRERERRQGQAGERLTLMPFVIKALVAGLKEYRMFNASLDPVREELVFKRYYNIGVAVDSPKGLLVPVIHRADGMSVLELAGALWDLAVRAREDRLEPQDYRGGTFTVSNIGNLGGFSPNPMVNYPEVALLGMGRAEPKPVVEGGDIVVRTRMPLALSFDHRIADGGEAARFMNDLKRRLSDPTALLLET